MRGLGEIFYLFKSRSDSALLPRFELGKAVRECITLQARALTGPCQEFWFDVNANHGMILLKNRSDNKSLVCRRSSLGSSSRRRGESMRYWNRCHRSPALCGHCIFD